MSEERVERRLAAILGAANAIGWWAERCLITLLLAVCITQARGQPVAEPQPYTEVFYSSGPLRIQAYLYRPLGDGPFPQVIYNHGSRENRERARIPAVSICREGLAPERLRRAGAGAAGIWPLGWTHIF
jgi:hypothetical protein